MGEDFNAINDHVGSTIRSVASYTSERLDADDKSLEAITRLKLSGDTLSSDPDAKVVDQWCRSLITFRTAAIKAQIANTYDGELERAIVVTEDSPANAEKQEELHALQAELDTLREEITSVTEMVVDHNFRKPITASIEGSATDRRKTQREWLDYILSSIRYITGRANALSLHTSQLRGFQEALIDVKAILATQVTIAPKELPTSPKLERNTSGLRPLLLNRTASGTIDSEDPIRLLRALDADIEIGKDGMTAGQLRALLRSKLARAEAQKLAVESSNLHALSEYLKQETTETQAVRGALYAHTDFNTKRMADSSTEERLQQMEGAVGVAGQGITAFESVQAEPLPPNVQRMVKNNVR